MRRKGGKTGPKHLPATCCVGPDGQEGTNEQPRLVFFEGLGD